MDSNLIASFKIRTPFYNVVNCQHLILCGLTALATFIPIFFLLSYLIGQANAPWFWALFFTFVSVANVDNFLGKLNVRNFDNSTLLFHTDKVIIKEHYEIKKHKSRMANFMIEQMVKFAKPVNKITEYSYVDISRFDLFYAFTKQNQNQRYVLGTNNFHLDLAIGNQKEKIRLFVPDMSAVMQMQRVLKHLYALNLNISEGTSENKKTYLLYYKDDSNKKMLDLIDEIGKDEQEK